MKITDVSQVLNELNGGAFEQQVGTALSDVALNVATHGKDGEVTIKLKLKRIGDGRTVSIDHTLSYSSPTARGRRTEETTAKTPHACQRWRQRHALPGGPARYVPVRIRNQGLTITKFSGASQ